LTNRERRLIMNFKQLTCGSAMALAIGASVDGVEIARRRGVAIVAATADALPCGPPKFSSAGSWNGATQPPLIGSGTHTPAGIPSAPG